MSNYVCMGRWRSLARIIMCVDVLCFLRSMSAIPDWSLRNKRALPTRSFDLQWKGAPCSCCNQQGDHWARHCPLKYEFCIPIMSALSRVGFVSHSPLPPRSLPPSCEMCSSPEAVESSPDDPKYWQAGGPPGRWFYPGVGWVIGPKCVDPGRRLGR